MERYKGPAWDAPRMLGAEEGTNRPPSATMPHGAPTSWYGGSYRTAWRGLPALKVGFLSAGNHIS